MVSVVSSLWATLINLVAVVCLNGEDSCSFSPLSSPFLVTPAFLRLQLWKIELPSFLMGTLPFPCVHIPFLHVPHWAPFPLCAGAWAASLPLQSIPVMLPYQISAPPLLCKCLGMSWGSKLQKRAAVAVMRSWVTKVSCEGNKSQLQLYSQFMQLAYMSNEAQCSSN